MAELILTKEEKEAASYLDWDDEAVGKMVRHAALKLMRDGNEDNEALFPMTAAHIMVGHTVTLNARTAEYDIEGFTLHGEPQGNWKVTVKKVED